VSAPSACPASPTTPTGDLHLLADAGAAVLRPSEGESGIIDVDLYSDGRYGDLLIQPAGGSRHPASHETVARRQHYVQMKGNEVFKVAVRMFEDCAQRILEKNGFTPEDIDVFVPHQANLRIIEAAVKRLKLPMDRVVINVDRYGNTGAASVYVALEEAVTSQRIKPGDLVLLAAFGGGFTWGAALLGWLLWYNCGW
jgi:3-oxoacyl-[acyl-carrier-protein] synthase-3